MKEYNVHHRWWPKRDYKTPLEKAFRELPENKVRMRVDDHRKLHATTEPPKKPSIESMRLAVQRSKEQAA